MKFLFVSVLTLLISSSALASKKINVKCSCYEPRTRCVFDDSCEYWNYITSIKFETTRENYKEDGNKACKKEVEDYFLDIDFENIESHNCKVLR